MIHSMWFLNSLKPSSKGPSSEVLQRFCWSYQMHSVTIINVSSLCFFFFKPEIVNIKMIVKYLKPCIKMHTSDFDRNRQQVLLIYLLIALLTHTNCNPHSIFVTENILDIHWILLYIVFCPLSVWTEISAKEEICSWLVLFRLCPCLFNIANDCFTDRGSARLVRVGTAPMTQEQSA